jgi:hypothetical protein
MPQGFAPIRIDEEGFGWPLQGVANVDGLIRYCQETACTPLNAADASVMSSGAKDLPISW